MRARKVERLQDEVEAGESAEERDGPGSRPQPGERDAREGHQSECDDRGYAGERRLVERERVGNLREPFVGDPRHDPA